MHHEIEQALQALIAAPLRGASRVVDTLRLEFADPGLDAASGLALHVACAWRLTDGERVLVGSGDLFTPADPDEEPETFDWEPAGASWLDVRLGELAEKRNAAAHPPTVSQLSVDLFGGARLTLTDGLVLELFPNSTPTGHVSTEFWRLTRAGADDFVVGTFGVEREPASEG